MVDQGQTPLAGQRLGAPETLGISTLEPGHKPPAMPPGRLLPIRVQMLDDSEEIFDVSLYWCSFSYGSKCQASGSLSRCLISSTVTPSGAASYPQFSSLTSASSLPGCSPAVCPVLLLGSSSRLTFLLGPGLSINITLLLILHLGPLSSRWLGQIPDTIL